MDEMTILQKLICEIDRDTDIPAELKKRKKAYVLQLMQSAAQYITKVVEQGVQIQMLEGQVDRETKEMLAGIDASRTKIHDSLIVKINVVNRLCAEYNLDLICPGEDNRRQKGDFALELVTQYFQDRI
ncbi:MAG: hypothetical protein CVU90_07205 [Firmicutes bacterium HGW-Firmicutes-15]|nr:MAG: hypothetical protein CVU90_07205 [Firmicutes bacterium HGW-Firmicutes-15]